MYVRRTRGVARNFKFQRETLKGRTTALEYYRRGEDVGRNITEVDQRRGWIFSILILPKRKPAIDVERMRDKRR